MASRLPGLAISDTTSTPCGSDPERRRTRPSDERRPPTMIIDATDVPALERGASLLASGGGGSTVTVMEGLIAALEAGGEIRLTSLRDVPAGARVVPVGGIGSAVALSEKPPSGGEMAAAVAAICSWTGESADALIPAGFAGVNALLPFMLGMRLDLPWVDADLAGRGLSRMDQTSVCAAGRELTPLALAETSGQRIVVADGSAIQAGRTSQMFVSGSSGWAFIAIAPIAVQDLFTCAVPATVTSALRLGRLSLDAGTPPDLTGFAAEVGGRLLVVGRVVEISRRPGPSEQGLAGFSRGSAMIATHTGRSVLRLEMGTEYVVAFRDGEVVATTPDVLVVVDRRTGTPVACDAVRTGLDVGVLQLPGPRFWKEPSRIAVLAPRAYGIDTDPVVLPPTAEQ
jgi:hypothetical protein